jgi:hypothetical protein
VYEGQFRVVQPDIVLADVAAQVAAGAGHITFGDPDFFNGPTHAMRIVTALHEAHPGVSYDVTDQGRASAPSTASLVPKLAATGCAFVTSAIESVDDAVLSLFDKGHTRADFLDAVALCRGAGVTLVPTFVAFHPLAHPRVVLRSARHDRGARSRRSRVADPARDPPAGAEGIAAAGAGRDAPAPRSVRRRNADVSAGRTPIRASTRCSAT